MVVKEKREIEEREIRVSVFDWQGMRDKGADFVGPMYFFNLLILSRHRTKFDQFF